MRDLLRFCTFAWPRGHVARICLRTCAPPTSLCTFKTSSRPRAVALADWGALFRGCFTPACVLRAVFRVRLRACVTHTRGAFPLSRSYTTPAPVWGRGGWSVFYSPFTSPVSRGYWGQPPRPASRRVFTCRCNRLRRRPLGGRPRHRARGRSMEAWRFPHDSHVPVPRGRGRAFQYSVTSGEGSTHPTQSLRGKPDTGDGLRGLHVLLLSRHGLAEYPPQRAHGQRKAFARVCASPTSTPAPLRAVGVSCFVFSHPARPRGRAVRGGHPAPLRAVGRALAGVR